MSDRDVLISWLNDAYAMENALIPVLENHAKDAKDHPAVQARIQEHVTETRQHSKLVKKCLERLGESPSMTKMVAGSLFGTAQAPVTGMTSDELVKNAVADFATENFEIAAYEVVIAAARHCGETEIADSCEQIRDQERMMAQWLQENLGSIVKEYCEKAAGDKSSR